MTDSLAKAGFSMGKATNAAAPEAELDVSKVYFVAAPPEAEAVARSVAQAMGITDIQAIPTPAPTKSGDIGDAGVLVMLGKDTAGKPLAAFVAATTTTATTVAPAAQAPIQSTTTTG